MKLKNSAGTVYKSMAEAFFAYCTSKSSCVCEMKKNAIKWPSCAEWAAHNQDEAARALGLEIIQEDGDNNNVPAKDVTDINVGNKPLAEWTLAEVTDYCNGRSCEECMFSVEHKDPLPIDSVCGFKHYNPFFWPSLWKNEFTPEEVADAKAIARLLPLPVDGIRRDDEGTVSVTYCGRWAGRLTRDAFPSIKPGQSVKLSEIIGEPEA